MAKRLQRKKKTKGIIQSGSLYVMVILLLLITGAFIFSGGVFPQENPTQTGPRVIINPPDNEKAKSNLQLYTFTGVTVTVAPFPDSPPGNCGSIVTDTEMIIDVSGSMAGITLQRVRTAARAYIDVVSANPSSRVGITTFSSSSQLLTTLTSDKNAMTSAADQINGRGASCVQCGIKTGNADIKTNKREGIKTIAILLTDGRANRVASDPQDSRSLLGGGLSDLRGDAVSAARTEAATGFKESGTNFYTIGFGNMGVNEPFLRSVASDTGGTYYLSPSDEQLRQAFLAITQKVCIADPGAPAASSGASTP